MLIFIALLGICLTLIWQMASADAPYQSHPAHTQIKQILPSLQDSEAEHVAGAYIPGVGAVITIDLLHGPNSVEGQPSHESTLGWLLYLMQTFGPQLDAVPTQEIIAISIDFYDYDTVVYHHLVATCAAANAADPGKYQIWLNGTNYAEAAARLAETTLAPDEQQPPQPTAVPVESSASPVPAETSVSPLADTPGPAGETIDLGNAETIEREWVPLGEYWQFTEEGYAQTELNKYDLISLLNRKISGDFHFQADIKFVEGEMGGGLIFNTPSSTGKNGAQMVSYTGAGTFLQWGYYDDEGVFQYQNGVTVPDGSDGQWHTMEVDVSGDTFSLRLDGIELAQGLELHRPSDGYVGLLASTSHVVFANIRLEGPGAVAIATATPSTESEPVPETIGEGALNVTLDFDDPQAAEADWVPLSGEWEFAKGGYAQRIADQYDLISMLNIQTSGDMRFQANVKTSEGEMGGGLVFNAPANNAKNSAQMISYTGAGTYLQWGYFDNDGGFQFQGGATVPDGSDGQWHTLAVAVTGNAFSVTLDSVEIAQNIPLFGSPGGYAGLLASTSRVVFDDVKLEGVQP